MNKAQDIREAISANPKAYLYGNYQELADKLETGYDYVRKVARILRNEATTKIAPIIPSINTSFPNTSNHLINYEGSILREHMEKVIHDTGQYSVIITSDSHGWLADLRAHRTINKILQDNHFDELVLNGDMLDLPFLSAHTPKLYQDGILRGYSEVEEIRYTREQLLAPMRHSTNAKIRYRLGNHDERLTKPLNISKSQLARLAVLYKHYDSTHLPDILGLDDLGIDYDPSNIFSYFNIFEVVHGLSLAKNAPEKNIISYQSSGASGHDHRLGLKYFTTRRSTNIWITTGCLRLKEQVEYFPTAVIPDWQHGFGTVTFYKRGSEIFPVANVHPIINGRTNFNGKFYDGNYE